LGNVVDLFTKAGIEPDQRLLDALRMQRPRIAVDSIPLLYALQKLNVRGLHLLPHLRAEHPDNADLRPPQEASSDFLTNLNFSGTTTWLLESAAAHVGPTRSLGAAQVLKAIVTHALDNPGYEGRAVTLDHIVAAASGDRHANVKDVPQLQKLLRLANDAVDGVEDYQYILTFDDKGIRFRIVSTLGDYSQATESGLWVPQRALLTHIDSYGFFTKDSIDELEALINNAEAKEQEFQEFFERHPGYLRQWDYREVHPHVYLQRSDMGPLIPDFILTNPEAQRAAIVELKRAGAMVGRVVRHQDNRVRFADAVMEARAQLLQYRDWFDDHRHRDLIKNAMGLEIYRPRMMVIIGRASDFRPGIERARLEDHNRDIELITYDDILRYAKNRRAIIESPPAIHQS
jgi:hypothetical protein